MSQIKVDTITNAEDNGPVYFPKGMLGDASHLIYPPQVLSFDPTPLSTGISTASEQNITVTFNQGIVFSGVGTISLRQGSATGTELESYTCGVSTRATIAGESLVVKPSVQLGINTSIYLVLPSTGIANTSGGNYVGSSSYFFQTITPGQNFSATGGTHEFTRADGSSPTGYYKYHIFTSSGPFVTTGPSFDATEFSSVLVAGGGGGGSGGGGAGGVISSTGPSLALPEGTFTITLGSGGAPTPNNSNAGSDGSDSTISTPTDTLITAYGGGGGGALYAPSTGGNPGGSGGGSNPAPSNLFGTGVPGQGNPGGTGATPSSWTQPGGGGGGSGGNGGTGNVTAPGTPSTLVGGTGGAGGIGAPQPAFTTPILSGFVPTIPASSLNEIGTSGRYGGGGGGGAPANPPGSVPRPVPAGGSGGGGNGSNNTIRTAENGFVNTGGGGGGGHEGPGVPGNPWSGRSGGSGVFMVRYATPAP